MGTLAINGKLVGEGLIARERDERR